MVSLKKYFRVRILSKFKRRNLKILVCGGFTLFLKAKPEDIKFFWGPGWRGCTNFKGKPRKTNLTSGNLLWSFWLCVPYCTTPPKQLKTLGFTKTLLIFIGPPTPLPTELISASVIHALKTLKNVGWDLKNVELLKV